MVGGGPNNGRTAVISLVLAGLALGEHDAVAVQRGQQVDSAGPSARIAPCSELPSTATVARTGREGGGPSWLTEWEASARAVCQPLIAASRASPSTRCSTGRTVASLGALLTGLLRSAPPYSDRVI